MGLSLEADGFQRANKVGMKSNQLLPVKAIERFIGIQVKIGAGVYFIKLIGDDKVFDEADAEDLIGGVVHFHDIEEGVKRDGGFDAFALAIDVFAQRMRFAIKRILRIGFVGEASGGEKWQHNQSTNIRAIRTRAITIRAII